MCKRIISCIMLFVILAGFMLSGCTGSVESQNIPEVTDAAVQNTQETASGAETENSIQLQQPQAPEIPVIPENDLEIELEVEPDAHIDPMPMPMGGVLPPQVLEPGEEVPEEKIQEIERSMRDYSGPRYDLSWEYYPRNWASSYVYYDLLSWEDQMIYDAMLLTTMDPYAKEFHAYCYTSMDPSSEEFYQAYSRVYQCMTYDHPELFWLRLDDGPSITYCYRRGSDGEVYFYLKNMNSKVKDYIYTFNRGTDAYLALVDDFSSQVNTARKVHDLLLHNVSYDYYGSKNNGADPLIYTAYAALVKNGRGEAFTAVCGGYANAFLYLMQMLGGEGAVVLGYTKEMELHAWNLIKLNGAWTEVDVTWDDIDFKGAYENYYEYQTYYDEMTNDPRTYDRLTHAFFCIPTWKMTDFKGIPEYNYITRDRRYTFYPIGNSNHYRLENDREYAIGSVVAQLPVAK